MNKLSYIIPMLLAFLAWLSACNRDYQTLPPQNQDFAIYSTGIISNPVPFDDSTAFAITIDQNSQLWLVKLNKYGQLTTVAQISDLFKGAWNMDSLYYISVGRFKQFFTITQTLTVPLQGKFGRTILLDTSGQLHAIIDDKLRIDTFFNVTYLTDVPARDYVYSIYHVSDSAMNNFLWTQLYDAQGNLVTCRIRSWSESQVFTYYFNHSGKLGFILQDVLYDTTFAGLWDLDQDSIILVGIRPLLFTIWATPVSPDRAIFSMLSLEAQNYYLQVDFAQQNVQWEYVSEDFKNTIVTCAVPYADATIILAAKYRTNLLDFSYAAVSKKVANFTLAFVQDGQLKWAKNIPISHLTPMGVMKLNDTTFTSFSYGKTFNYFPATYIVRFNQLGKIY